MANLGRVYPRAFRRDYGWRDNPSRFSYLANRIMVRMSGPQWAAFGWPTTLMMSDNATVDDSIGRMTWNFSYTSTIYPSSTFKVHWDLTFTESWWKPYWIIYVSPSLWRYAETPTALTFPVSFPEVSRFNWKKPDGSAANLMAIAEVRAAIWSDY